LVLEVIIKFLYNKRTTKKAAGAGLIFPLQRPVDNLLLLLLPFNKTDN